MNEKSMAKSLLYKHGKEKATEIVTSFTTGNSEKINNFWKDVLRELKNN